MTIGNERQSNKACNVARIGAALTLDAALLVLFRYSLQQQKLTASTEFTFYYPFTAPAAHASGRESMTTENEKQSNTSHNATNVGAALA